MTPLALVLSVGLGLGVHFFALMVGGFWLFQYRADSVEFALGTMLGYLAGSIIDPDLDLMGVTKAEGRMMKIPILGHVLFGIWSMYGSIFRKHHRSFWTHSYLFSTLIRWALQFFWLGYNWPVLWPTLIGVYAGLSVSDALHIYLDRHTR